MSQNLQPWKIIILAKIKGVPKQTVSQNIQYIRYNTFTSIHMHLHITSSQLGICKAHYYDKIDVVNVHITPHSVADLFCSEINWRYMDIKTKSFSYLDIIIK